MSHHKEGHH